VGEAHLKKTLIREAWLSYRDQVIPRNAGSTQLMESRRAFYAGANALLTSIMGALDPESEPTEADFSVMQDIQSELDEFVKQVKAGIS
jgi:hypothetical protein